ncbi:MAG: ATP-binding protein [bacterium]
MKRNLYTNALNSIVDDKKILLVTGARQSGKTTIAKQFMDNFKNGIYFNYDSDRKYLLNNPRFYEEQNKVDDSPLLVVFDELHKYRSWKTYMKGNYDRNRDDFRYLVTGSGDLNISYKTKESLAGRFELIHVFPFTLNEFFNRCSYDEFFSNPIGMPGSLGSRNSFDTMNGLLNISPFPEPFLKSSKQFYKRWSKSYFPQIINIDLKYSAVFHELDKLETLFDILSLKVCSGFSYSNVANDIEVSPPTVKQWMKLLESHFLTFSLAPYGKFSRTIKKQRKVYLYDYGRIENESSKYENFVALELFRFVKNANDFGESVNMFYVKDKDQREVDFIITYNGKPFLLIEAKENDEDTKNLKHFQTIFKIPAVLLVRKSGIHKLLTNGEHKITVISADKFLSTLP